MPSTLDLAILVNIGEMQFLLITAILLHAPYKNEQCPAKSAEVVQADSFMCTSGILKSSVGAVLACDRV